MLTVIAKNVMTEFKILKTKPLSLYCNNKVAINIAYNLVQHDRTKYVEIERHFIKGKLTNGQLFITFAKPQHQLYDVFSKGLSCNFHLFYAR